MTIISLRAPGQALTLCDGYCSVLGTHHKSPLFWFIAEEENGTILMKVAYMIHPRPGPRDCYHIHVDMVCSCVYFGSLKLDYHRRTAALPSEAVITQAMLLMTQNYRLTNC